MKKLLIVLSLIVVSSLSFAEWDATSPTGSEPISQGDDEIRELKTDIETALTAEGTFPGPDTSSPVFYWNPSTGTTASRPTGDNAQTGRVYINTSSDTFEIIAGDGSFVGYRFVTSSGVTESDLDISVAGDGIFGGGGEALRLGYDASQFEISGDSLTLTQPLVLSGTITSNGYQNYGNADIDGDLRVDGISTSTGQPSFLAFNSATDINKTGNGVNATVEFDTETYDLNNDFSSNVFTAPVTGYYLLTTAVQLNDLRVTAHPDCQVRIVKSSGVEWGDSKIFPSGQAADKETFSVTVIDYMTPGQTASVTARCTLNGQDVDIDGYNMGPRTTWFSGVLLH